MSTDTANMPTGSYARIRNPRLLLVIRVGLLAIFALLTVIGLLSLPASYRDTRDSIISQPDTLRDLSNLGISVDVGATYSFVVVVVQALSYTAAGFLIFFYRSDDWTAILFSCVLVGNGIGGLIYAHSGFPILKPILILQPIIAWMPVFPALCLFPDGRLIPRWSVWLVPLSILSCVPLVYVNYMYWAEGISIDAALRAGIALVSGLFWCIGTGFLLVRLRRTEIPAHRQQIKQFFAGMLAILFTSLVFPLLSLVPVIGTSALFNVVLLPIVTCLGALLFSVLLTFAILRFRLWDIDLVLNQGIVYAGLFIVLVLIFIGVVFVLQAGLEAVFGTEQTTIAAMVSTGAVALLFNPTRLRLQPLVDRWMFGLRFDLNMLGADNRSRSRPRVLADLNTARLEVYEIKELIGRGGMGEVYRGVQSPQNREVAVKVLLPHLSANPEFRTRFERESRIAASLHHPNIITIFDFGDVAGMPYMVMEYMQGPDLSDYLHGRALSLDEAEPLITPIADALTYAHTQGVVHRDVKPSNIMLKQQPDPGVVLHPILMDFGLTKLADSPSALTQSGPLGTLAYMAPEQIAAAREADHRADIYALGVMCYQILIGKLPFSSSNQAALLFAHLHKPPPDPRMTVPDFPERAAAALMRALDKEPDNRQQSAGAFAADLFAPS